MEQKNDVEIDNLDASENGADTPWIEIPKVSESSTAGGRISSEMDSDRPGETNSNAEESLRPERKKRSRSENNKRTRSRTGKKPVTFNRFVAVAWSGEREPAGDLVWAEASIDGEWIVIEKLERLRMRREVVEKILELESGLVALDFNFSFPEPYFEFLSQEGIPDWRTMVRTVREDLKKNMDDGVRLWLERMGRYREASLDESAPRRYGIRDRKDRGWNFDKKESRKPYELQSRAERFRRTDLPLVPLAGANVMSTLQIGYNRLTERYEFNGNHRGRNSLLGMAMLGQLLDSDRPDLSIWPFSELKRLTVVETLPWLFTEGKRLDSKEFALRLANYEDSGWEIPDEVIRTGSIHTTSQQTLFTLIGMLKTERRMLRNRFPIRFYSPQIYGDARVQLEGWTYGINYRVPEHTDPERSEAERSEPETTELETEKVTEDSATESAPAAAQGE